MSSRNVAVQRDVFDALLREKRRGESFTQLFRRLLDRGDALDELTGVWGASRHQVDRRALRQLRPRKGA